MEEEIILRRELLFMLVSWDTAFIIAFVYYFWRVFMFFLYSLLSMSNFIYHSLLLPTFSRLKISIISLDLLSK